MTKFFPINLPVINSELKNLQAVFYVHFVSKMLSSCRFENGFCVQALFRTEAIIRVVMNFKCYVVFIFHLKLFSSNFNNYFVLLKKTESHDHF